MRPAMAKWQQSDQIWIENDPDLGENRLHASLFAFASFSIGNCSDIP